MSESRHQKNSKPKKPFYKKVWFWLVAGFFLIGFIGSLVDGESYAEEKEDTKKKEVVAEEKPKKEDKAEKKEEPKKEVAEKKEDAKEDKKEQAEAKEDKKEESEEATVEESPKLSKEELKENQKKNLRESLDAIIEAGQGVIVDIDFQKNHSEDGEFMAVVVSDAWYNSPEHEKERFADAIGEQVRYAVWNSGLKEHGKIVVVDIFDMYDKEVASYKIISGKYKIKG